MKTREEIEQLFNVQDRDPISRRDIEQYIETNTSSTIPKLDRDWYLDNIQFLSPNEPITPQGIERVLNQIKIVNTMLSNQIGVDIKSITLWNQNMSYDKDDMVLFFKQEESQTHHDVGKREFAFILISTVDNNTSVPNYDIVDGIPNFINTNWELLNPLSYLLQDLVQLKNVIKSIFSEIINEHIYNGHGIIGTQRNLDSSLLRKDYSNLTTINKLGKFSLITPSSNQQQTVKWSNGIVEHRIEYGFDIQANPIDIRINDNRYYYQKSPIHDESDDLIFAQKYIEDDLFQVTVNKEINNKQGVPFTNLRFGTNIFHAKITLPFPMVNDEYMVFFDTHPANAFVFGFNKADIEGKKYPTYDAIVSQPMILNKTINGFEVILPIHTYFNSIQKYKIGVPWENKFKLQVIGRFR